MELTRFQKIMLAVVAGMLVFFSLLLLVFRGCPGVMFEESLLKITEYEGQTVYSGKARGTPVNISVTWPTNFRSVVEFTIGERFHDICEVEYPLEPIQTERGTTVNGIRVTKNGALIFQGGYDPDASGYGWFNENGKWTPKFGLRADYPNDPWRDYETTEGDAARFAFGPDSAAHGEPAVFAMAVFLSVILVVDILFHKELFRLRHWAARDPEPTEEYLAWERAGWVILAVIIAFVYIFALVQIS